jgi:hypothetical protein
MGKLISSTVVTREDQLTKLVGGPYHILTGANLVKRKPKPKKKREAK